MTLRVLICSLVFLFASGAQAQTIQLACKVKWEATCYDARLIKQQCPPLLGETASGSLVIEGGKARTKNLGVVTTFAVTKKSPNLFAFVGEWSGPGQFVVGHGTLDSATWQLRLFMTLAKDRDDPDFVQRGFIADCG